MRSVLAAVVSMLLLGAMAPSALADAPPPDVQAIMERIRSGQPPTPAEQQRLRSWMTQAAATRAAAPMSTPDGKTAQAPAAMVAGELRLDVAQETRRVDGDKSNKTVIDGSVTVPVLFALREEAKGVVRVVFRADPARRPRGGAHLHGTEKGNGREIDDDLRLDATEATLFSGELYADASRPRPYLRVTQSLMGDLKKTRTTTEGKQPPKVETATAHTVVPFLPLSYDEYRADVPWLRGLDGASLGVTPAPPMTRETAAKLAPEIRAASDKATFAIDARALAAALKAGKPFKLAGKLVYGTIKNEGAVRTTTSSRVTLELSIPKPAR